MRHDASTAVTPYRIGWWTHQWWPRKVMLVCFLIGKQPQPSAATGSRKAHRSYYAKHMLRRLRMIRRPHRPWQAEADVCRFARRAFTADGAVRKMTRDVEHLLATGRQSWHQRRKLWSVRTRCRIGLHRFYKMRHGRACLHCGIPAPRFLRAPVAVGGEQP